MKEEMDCAVDKMSSLKGGNKFVVLTELLEECEIIRVVEDMSNPPAAFDRWRKLLLAFKIKFIEIAL